MRTPTFWEALGGFGCNRLRHPNLCKISAIGLTAKTRYKCINVARVCRDGNDVQVPLQKRLTKSLVLNILTRVAITFL